MPQINSCVGSHSVFKTCAVSFDEVPYFIISEIIYNNFDTRDSSKLMLDEEDVEDHHHAGNLGHL